ncbi:SDR family oxidoreductase [Terrarubrum flagellatum]|uniref:SDR family oxidoreductase n=1 Tax=Terrirubrum flagellatum TaxID=2895980 RepID=UPI0031454F56
MSELSGPVIDEDVLARWRQRLAPADLAALPTVYAPDLLKDQVYLVSGGGTGFGRVMTFLFARLGAKVVICGRREDKLKETAAEVKEALGAEVVCKPMSIRKPEEIDALFDDVFEQCGRLDVLVNNAGGQYPQNALDFTVKGWNAVIDLNLNGTWYMTQAAARRWKERAAPGAIVNIVATIFRGMPQVAHTCAARAGVIFMSKSVAVEWAPLGIRVNCLAPGSMQSEGLEVYSDTALTRFPNSNPMRRLGDAWDVAQGVVYLSAPSAKFITGEVLTIDGGGQMWGNTWPGGVPDYFNVV